MNKDIILELLKNNLPENGTCSEREFFKLFSFMADSDLDELITIFYEAGYSFSDEQLSVNLSEVDIYDYIVMDYSKYAHYSNEDLCVAYQQGDSLAITHLYKENKGWIWRIARDNFHSVPHHKLSLDDLFQAGCMGFIRAAKSFDIDFSVKFTTYSYFWIRQSILRFQCDYGFTVRVPVHLMEKILKIIRTPGIDVFTVLKAEDILKIEDVTGFSNDEIKKILLVYYQMLNITSLNQMVGEDESSELIDFLPNEMNVLEEVDRIFLKQELEKMLGLLKPKERLIIELRFGIDNKVHTLEEIGQQLGVTRERVRQIESKALNRLSKLSKLRQHSGIKNYIK